MQSKKGVSSRMVLTIPLISLGMQKQRARTGLRSWKRKTENGQESKIYEFDIIKYLAITLK